MAKKLTDRQRFEEWWWRQPAGLAYADGWAAWQAALRSERRRGKHEREIAERAAAQEGK